MAKKNSKKSRCVQIEYLIGGNRVYYSQSAEKRISWRLREIDLSLWSGECPLFGCLGHRSQYCPISFILFGGDFIACCGCDTSSQPLPLSYLCDSPKEINGKNCQFFLTFLKYLNGRLVTSFCSQITFSVASRRPKWSYLSEFHKGGPLLRGDPNQNRSRSGQMHWTQSSGCGVGSVATSLTKQFHHVAVYWK